MGKVKGKILKKVVSAGVGLIPGGNVAKLAIKGAGAIGGLLGGRGRSGKRRSRGFSINKYVKKITKAKMDAKLMKIKLSALKGI